MSDLPTNNASRQAWLTVALLWPVALLNYLDRQIFSTMKQSIMSGVPDIATNEHFGDLMAVFLFVYGFFSPVGGYVADRFNRRWVIIVSLGVWSAITWLTGHATTYQQMWWARALMGVSEACYIPAALALIADFHRSGTRSRAVGIHQSGIYLGIILGGQGGYIADSSHGWRAAFHWFGLAGVIYAAVLLLCLKNGPKVFSDATRGPRPGVLMSLRQLFGIGSFILLILYFSLPAMPGWVVKSWMPALLAETFHLNQGEAGVSATLWITLASIGGVVIGSTLADRWTRLTPRGHVFVSAIGMAVCIPALFGIGYAPSLGVAIAFLILFGLGWGFFDANNMPILCQIVRPELRATGYGLMNMASVTVGGLAVKLVGAMRDAGSSPALIFTTFGIMAAIAVALVLMIRPHGATASTD
ncbi:MFS transporter [Luteolibacter ambystomatis]|uniref:MFS transporter n=1 Tax=Luteolibacter ambystomatis TaxID=2824561 RepID=A0A975PEP7_9BACT|nr:MFS transporter [Luteolibacter ambystomatis]QUE51579.1 MFS transporter [Luteolibacter ambystomatis]